MSLTGNPITDKKLVRVKQMYEHATLQAASPPNAMRWIRALLECDWAIETLLKAVYNFYKSGKPTKQGLSEMITQDVDPLLPANKGPIPQLARGYATQVRDIRNA